jgi:AAHS family 4-hydroxybenzoate transporter-like MFS transporter
MRATAVGWAMAMGRFGQVIGPLLVGALLVGATAISNIFLWCSVPAFIAAFVCVCLGHLHRLRDRAASTATDAGMPDGIVRSAEVA